MLEAGVSLDLDDLPNGIVVVRDGAGILAANREMLQILRCDRAWLIGQPLSAVLTRPAAMLYHASFYQQLRGVGHVAETYLDFKARDGAEVPALCTARMRSRDGVNEVLISATRMAERKRLEDDLLRTRRITEQIPGVVYQYLLRPDGSRCLPYASESLRDMFGVAPSRVVNDVEPLLASVHPDDLPDLELGIQVSATRLQPWRHEFRARRAPDAAYRWLEGSATPERHADGSIVWHGFLQDVTDRKRIDDAMREKAAADQANQAKSEFLARASHELRTPLNAILGFAQILAMDRRHPLLPFQHERVLHIADAGRDLLHLIDEVLDLTRVESGAVRLQPAWVDVRPLLVRIERLIEALARHKGVHLQLHVPEALRVYADPARLGQVLTNLLTNAIKYNREGGAVIVTASLEKDRVTLAIQDSGLGLSEEQVEHLFEPFNRLGAERSAVEGTGLGLVIVKRLVEAMDGSIVVSSSPGVGSTFRILLPHPATPEFADTASEPAADADAVVERASPARAARILYVEDNPINACVMQAIFEMTEGLELHLESTGAAAIEWIRTNTADLVLLDMHLPDYEGIALLHDLRIACPRGFPAAIAVSADAMPEIVETAKLAGFSQYWTKPLDAALTLDRIHEAVRSRVGERVV